MRSAKLADLLPGDILQAIEPILDDLEAGVLSFDEGRRRLSALLAPEEQRLLEKGVLKDYLVYVLLGSALDPKNSHRLN